MDALDEGPAAEVRGGDEPRLLGGELRVTGYQS